MAESDETIPLSWARSDPEQRFGFRGGRFTRVNLLLSLLLGSLLSGLFYLALLPVRERWIGQTFYGNGPTPKLIVLLFFWSLVILVFKQMKLRLQNRSLEYSVVPEDPDFVLTPATVDEVIGRIYAISDDPRHFVLFNRLFIALSNLRNLGQVSDVDDILRSQASNDEASMETSYHLLQGLIWAIPVLGFIGTVLGLSEAIGGFGAVLEQTSELSNLKDALRNVTAGLSEAFETTLHGLVAAMIIQLWMTTLKVAEESFLDQCSEYGLRNVVGRLRLNPYDKQEV